MKVLYMYHFWKINSLYMDEVQFSFLKNVTKNYEKKFNLNFFKIFYILPLPTCVFNYFV